MQTVLLILVFHIKFLLQGKYPFIFSFRVEKPRSFCVSVVAMIRHKVFFSIKPAEMKNTINLLSIFEELTWIVIQKQIENLIFFMKPMKKNYD